MEKLNNMLLLATLLLGTIAILIILPIVIAGWEYFTIS